jgi:hypothetical protein
VASSSMGAGNPRWLAPEVLAGQRHSFASVRGVDLKLHSLATCAYYLPTCFVCLLPALPAGPCCLRLLPDHLLPAPATCAFCLGLLHELAALACRLGLPPWLAALACRLGLPPWLATCAFCLGLPPWLAA